MQGYNCIMVFHPEGDRLLFCLRTTDPYLGKYNLVGGKIEPGEDGFAAAYRELYEETGIGRQDIVLSHMWLISSLQGGLHEASDRSAGRSHVHACGLQQEIHYQGSGP